MTALLKSLMQLLFVFSVIFAFSGCTLNTTDDDDDNNDTTSIDDDDDNDDNDDDTIDPDVCDLSEFEPVAAASPNSLFSLASPGVENFALSISNGEVTELNGDSCEMTSNGDEGCDSYSPDMYTCGDCDFQVWEVEGVKKVALDSCADPGVPASCLADFCDDSYGKIVYDISSASGSDGGDCGGYDPCCETCDTDCDWCGTDMSCYSDCYGECMQCCHSCY